MSMKLYLLCYLHQEKDRKDSKQKKLHLNEKSIVWPGNENQKPKGIKISTHLRVSNAKPSVFFFLYQLCMDFRSVQLEEYFENIDQVRPRPK